MKCQRGIIQLCINSILPLSLISHFLSAESLFNSACSLLLLALPSKCQLCTPLHATFLTVQTAGCLYRRTPTLLDAQGKMAWQIFLYFKRNYKYTLLRKYWKVYIMNNTSLPLSIIVIAIESWMSPRLIDVHNESKQGCATKYIYAFTLHEASSRAWGDKSSDIIAIGNISAFPLHSFSLMSHTVFLYGYRNDNYASF